MGVIVCEQPTRFAVYCSCMSCLRVDTEAAAGERRMIHTGVLLLPACWHKVLPSDFLLIWSILNHRGARTVEIVAGVVEKREQLWKSKNWGEHKK